MILQLLISILPVFAADPCFDKPELSSLMGRSYANTQAVQGCFFSKALQQKVVVEMVFPAGYPFAEPIPPVYFLHGRGNNGSHFRKLGGVEALDQHLKTGGTSQLGRPMVVISPSETIHSYWKDRADGVANMAQMVTEDLTQYVDTHSGGRLLKGPTHRGLAGISMGGHGALYLGCRNQGNAFGRIHAISPVIRDMEQLRPEDYPVFVGIQQASPQDRMKQYGSFNKRDPRHYYSSIIPGGKKDFFCDYQIDYAENDYFIEKASRTHEFLAEVAKDHPDRVKFTEGSRVRVPASAENMIPVGHNPRYWKDCLPGLLRGMERLYPHSNQVTEKQAPQQADLKK